MDAYAGLKALVIGTLGGTGAPERSAPCATCRRRGGG